jgi:hypothetical protein
MKLVLESITDALDRLFRLAIKVRDPTTRQISSRVYSYKDVDKVTGVNVIEEYAKCDRQHILEILSCLGKTAPDGPCHYLIDRLSCANTLRRQHFGYWRRRRRKLKIVQSPSDIPIVSVTKKVQINLFGTPGEAAKPVQASTRTVSSKPYTASELDPTRINFEDERSNVSVSEYYPSASAPDNEFVVWPAPPSKLQGKKHFECPYCFTLCTSGYLEKRAWKAHLVRDLRPYVCTYEKCVDADRLYDTRSDWILHETSSHRQIWRCLKHANLIFQHLKDYEYHLQEEHLHEEQLRSSQLLKAGESTSELPDRPCPFCHAELSSAVLLQEHIARHLERIALFALPRSTGLEGESVEGSGWSGQAAGQTNSSKSNGAELESLSTFASVSPQVTPDPEIAGSQDQSPKLTTQCPNCGGDGFSKTGRETMYAASAPFKSIACDACGGTGAVEVRDTKIKIQSPARSAPSPQKLSLNALEALQANHRSNEASRIDNFLQTIKATPPDDDGPRQEMIEGLIAGIDDKKLVDRIAAFVNAPESIRKQIHQDSRHTRTSLIQEIMNSTDLQQPEIEFGAWDVSKEADLMHLHDLLILQIHRTEARKNEGSDSSADIFNQRPTTPHFYISWKHVVTRPEYDERPRTPIRRSCLNPPELKEAFLPSEPSPCYVWSPGRLSPISPSDKAYMEDYKVTSVFWCPDHQTYLTVPYDCTRYSVRHMVQNDPLQDWATLRFNHEAYKGRCVSVIGHCSPNHVLAASGSPSWIGELIPPIHQRHDEPAIPHAQGPSLLAGDISIIMALAAFSNRPELVKETTEWSFRPPNWVPHGSWNRAGEQFYAFPAWYLY